VEGSKSATTTPASSSAPAHMKAPGALVGASGQFNRDLSGVPAAQQLWRVSKAHLLELFQEGSRRRAVVQPAIMAAMRTRQALAEPMRATPIFEGRATIVPRREPPWLVEPEDQPVMMVPVAEVMMLETRHMTEPEHDIAVAELQHQPSLPEVSEVARLEAWGVPELEWRTTVAKCPKGRDLNGRDFPTPPVVELQALVSQVQLRRGVPWEMPKTETTFSCLGWLRYHPQRRHDSCEHHHFAHRGAP
jgi:hypothetical protein